MCRRLIYVYFGLGCLGLCLAFLSKVNAGPSYNQGLGTWTDTYADSAGVSSSSNAGVNTSTGVVSLKNAGGGYTAPFVSSGYIITSTIVPELIAKWKTLTLDANIPENTSINIKVLDEGNYVYSETALAGNTTGFTSFPLDLSSLQADKNANNLDYKQGRIRFRITLTTTDSSVSPTIDSVVLSWDRTWGDLSSGGLLDTACPMFGCSNKGRYIINSGETQADYITLRWKKDLTNEWGGGIFTRGLDDTIYLKTNGGFNLGPLMGPKIMALDRDDGSTKWSREISGIYFSSYVHAVSSSGTIYSNDHFNDTLSAYSTSDGSLKWMRSFSGGHGSYVSLCDDGTIYVEHGTATTTTQTLIAFNSDGNTKWSQLYNFGPKNFVSNVSCGTSQVYASFIVRDASSKYTGNGRVIAIDPVTGNSIWTYLTGDVGMVPILDDDETVYVGSVSSDNIEKKIYAINSNGSLKWEKSIGVTTDYYSSGGMRSDSNLFFIRTISSMNFIVEIRNRGNGDLVTSRSFVGSPPNLFTFIADRANGIIVTYRNGDNMGTFNYLDSDLNTLWSYVVPSGQSFSLPSVDEDNNFYLSNTILSGYITRVASFAPWTIEANDLSSSYYKAGDTINFIVTSSMLETDILQSETNKVQILLDNDDKVLLNYSETNTEGKTIWIGQYTLPDGLSDGEYPYTVEANSVGMVTDTTVHFDQPATNSQNKGIILKKSFLVDNTKPTISSVTALVSTDSATISWTTDETSSTQIEYGLTSSYGYTTNLKDDTTKVTNHTDTLINLLACTVYHYRVKSIDQAGNTIVSSDTAFSTHCHTSVTVDSQISQHLSASIGGAVQLMESNNTGIALTIPGNYSSQSAIFQIKKLAKASLISFLGTPSSTMSVAGGHIYDLSAQVNSSTSIDNFDTNLTLSISYDEGQIRGLIESSLSLYFYQDNDSAWRRLPNCSLNTTIKTITCLTNHFSTYALFGSLVDTTVYPSALACTASAPTTPAWLYAVVPKSATSVDIYYTDASPTVTHYVLSYGTSADKLIYGSQNIGGFGSRIYTVKYLLPNTNYYFQITPINDCAPGLSSDIVSSKPIKLTASSLLNSDLSTIDSIETDKYTQQELDDIKKSDKSDQINLVSLVVKLVGDNQQLITGASLELHSDVQTAITNDQGIATFAKVPRGQHKLFIFYNSKTVEHSLNLTDDAVKSYSITIKLKNTQSIPIFIPILFTFGSICLLVAVLVARKKSRSVF